LSNIAELTTQNADLLNSLESLESVEFDFDIMMPNEPLRLSCGAEGKIKGSNVDEDWNSLKDFSFDFEESVSAADRLDYTVAICSGMLTAALDIILIKEFSLAEAHTWGKDKTEKFVKAVARQKTNYKGDDLESAVRALEKAFPISADELTATYGGGKKHHLRDFSHHPTVVGLCFSIITQLTGYGFGTDTDGRLKVAKVSDELRGKDFPERIVKGTVDWLFHMISDMAGSSDSIKMGKEGTGLPGPMVSLLKEFSALPFAQNLRLEYRDSEIYFSQWISKLFNGTLLAQHDNDGKIIKGTEMRFDLRTEMGIGAHIVKNMVPVILNECIVRAFYMIRRLFNEIKNNNVVNLSGLLRINPASFMPINSRPLKRMLTVSSGTFMVIVTSKDLVTALIKSKGNKRKFATYFLLNINYFGIVRFAFACKNDASNISEDIKETYQKYVYEKKRRAVERNKSIPGIKSLLLNPNQTRILYSLKREKTIYDISCTKKEKDRKDKQKWLNLWQEKCCEEFNDDRFFIKDRIDLKSAICQELQIAGERWLYLVAIELNCFEPYYILSENDDNIKLRPVSDFEKDIFINMQIAIKEKELSKIRKIYSNYKSSLAGKKALQLAGAGATVAITAATGGLALAFAPQIAVVLAGSSFAGLSGAALTSASLAAVGGGSLAAGGLGMAGGTTIIAGGGVLLGIAGSGSMVMSASLLISSKEKTLEECSKLLTYCKLILKKDEETLKLIRESINTSIKKLEFQIEKIGQSNANENKEEVKNLRASLKYLKKSESKLERL